MARSHGRILTTIWADPDFLALGPRPQRLYMFLLSQPDLAHCGLIALRERRWARAAQTLTPDDVQADLDALDEHGFVVVDRDTEEVLIRSLIRRDDVWRQPNVLAAAVAQIDTIISTRIRTALAAELARIRRGDGLTDRTRALLDTALAALPGAAPDTIPGDPSGKGSPNPSGNPSPGLIRESARRSGVGERYVSRERVPLPPSPEVPPPAEAPAAPRDETAQTLLAGYLRRCGKRPPRQVLGHLGRLIAGMLDEGITADDIRHGLDAWAAKGLHPATLPSVVNEVMNGHRPPAGDPRAATAPSRNAQILAAARQRALAAEGAAS